MTGSDVKKNEFVGTFGLISSRHIDRITGVLEIEEIDALDNATLMNVEARNDAFG
jgi:hypothetical protein